MAFSVDCGLQFARGDIGAQNADQPEADRLRFRVTRLLCRRHQTIAMQA